VGQKNGRHVYQLYTVTLRESINRDDLITDLEERGIASKVYWDPIHLTEFYREEGSYEPGAFPTTEEIASRVLSLPIHPRLAPEEIERIVNAINEFIDHRQ
jgi:perosamine synthetase